MTRTQETALAAGALTIGAALLARGLRAARAFDFDGASIVVTGGRGLALELARQLGRDGARLTLAARDEAELERARQDLAGRGIDAATVVCDIRNRDDARKLVRDVVARTGRIDVLINNAGVIQVGPLEHMQRGDFEEAMAVHFWGPLHTMLEAIPDMKRHGGGRIVNGLDPRHVHPCVARRRAGGRGTGDRRRSGWQSMSDAAPSKLTALTEKAAAENNQLPH